MLATSLRSVITDSYLHKRFLHVCQAALSANSSPLFKLRQKTGLAYSLCREALNKHDNNVIEAEAWLKAHAITHGLQKVNKVRDRSTKEGLVCLSVPKDNRSTTIIELNCETDFVAKNQLFKDFAIHITERVSSGIDNFTSCDSPTQTVIKGVKPNESLIKEIEDEIVPMITKLGENIKLAKVLRLQPVVESETTLLFGQIHAQAAKKITDQYDIMAGRFGAIVTLRLLEGQQGSDHDSLKTIGARLCQHIIGFNPSYIELPENVRKNLEMIEKERLEIKTSSGAEAAEGGLSDGEIENSSSNIRDDWPSIMDQTLIMTNDIIVRDFCKMNNVSIIHFDRLECGVESW